MVPLNLEWNVSPGGRNRQRLLRGGGVRSIGLRVELMDRKQRSGHLSRPTIPGTSRIGGGENARSRFALRPAACLRAW